MSHFLASLQQFSIVIAAMNCGAANPPIPDYPALYLSKFSLKVNYYNELI